jgi:hypothetical protein
VVQVHDASGALKYTINQVESFDLSVSELRHTYEWHWRPELETITATHADGTALFSSGGISPAVPGDVLGLGAKNGLVEPQSGSGELDARFLSGTILFDFFFYSPVFTATLSATDKLTPTVTMAPGGFEAEHPDLQLATLGDRLPVLHDRQGALRTLVPKDDGRLHLSHTYGGPGTIRWRDSIPGTGASLWKDASGVMFANSLSAGQDGGAWQWYLWQANLEGMDWQPLRINGGEQVAIWQGGFSGVDTKPQRNGGYASIAQLEGDLYFTTSPDNLSRQAIRHVGPHNNLPCVLSVGLTADSRERYFITDGHDLQYVSYDGIKFDPVPV